MQEPEEASVSGNIRLACPAAVWTWSRIQPADSHRIVVGIDFTNPVHPFQRKDDRLARFIGNTAQYEAGIAALWNDRNLVQFAQLDDIGDLSGMSRKNGSQSLSGEPFTVVGHKGKHFCRIGNDVVAANQFFTEFDESWLCHGNGFYRESVS